jgi:hypothetical protein
MIKEMIAEFKKKEAEVAELESRIAHQLHEELVDLPRFYGFESLAHFIKAVKKAAKGSPKAKARKAAPVKRKRATITPAIRAKVKKLAKAGKTGAQIAKAVGISLPSVQNVKKAAGLVRTSKKSKAKAPAKRTATPKARKKRAAKKPAPAPVQAPAEAPAAPAA